jgi:serine/threonine protein kinase
LLTINRVRIDETFKYAIQLNPMGTELLLLGNKGIMATVTISPSQSCNTTIVLDDGKVIQDDSVNQIESHKNRAPVIITAIVLGIIILVVAFCIAIWIIGILAIRYRKLRKNLTLYTLLKQDYELMNDEPKSKMDNVVIKFAKLRFSSKLSEGASGIVFKGKWNNMEVAIKKLKVEDEDSFKREVTVLNSLRHPYIMMFYGLSSDDQDNNYIITEYVSHGGLDKLIYGKKKVKFSEKVRIMLEIAKGMTYLHQLNPSILHRDLKPQNILLDSNNRVKICDFGVSKPAMNRTMTGVTYGTMEYISPEILKESTEYSEKCDVYSFGIMMYETYMNARPYSVEDPALAEEDMSNLFNIGTRVLQGHRPFIPFKYGYQIDYKSIADVVKSYHYYNDDDEKRTDSVVCGFVSDYFNLCTKCWSDDPEGRPSFEEIDEELQTILDRL